MRCAVLVIGTCLLAATVASGQWAVIRGVLFLEGDCPRTETEGTVPEWGPSPEPVLIDATGRKVLNLESGANDVSRLASGVYFVRAEPQAVREVIIAR